MNKEEFRLTMKKRNLKAYNFVNFDIFKGLNEPITYRCEMCSCEIIMKNARSFYSKQNFICQKCLNNNNINDLLLLLDNIGLKPLNDDIYKKDVFTVTDIIECYIYDDTKRNEYRKYKGAIVSTNINRLKNKTIPLPIHTLNKHSIENIKKYILNNKIDCKVISTQYINKTSMITFECKCGELFETRWNTFLNTNKRKCDKCGNKEGAKKKIKTGISKYGSFKDLLYLEYGDDWINIWDFDKNKVNPNDISCTSNKKIWLRCKIKSYHTYQSTCVEYKSGKRCGYCVGKILHPRDSFGEVYPEYAKYWCEKNDKTCYEVFCRTTDKFWFKCPEGKHNDNFKEVREIARGKCICTECYKESLGGEGHPNWKGGLSTLNAFLRSSIEDWKKEVMIKYGYKCDITRKERNFEIHHLIGFATIVSNFIKEYEIEVKANISEYSDSELQYIRKEFTKYHNKYGLGVLICEELHKLFHSIYGKNDGNNTPEQYYEFKEKYTNNNL